MKPAPWKCSCSAGAFGNVSHSQFTVTCGTCGEVAPWFVASRADVREETSSRSGTAA